MEISAMLLTNYRIWLCRAKQFSVAVEHHGSGSVQDDFDFLDILHTSVNW